MNTESKELVTCDSNLPTISLDPAGPMAFMDTASFNQMLTVAEMLSKSTLIPDHFQGKPANCFISLELAVRMKMSPFMVMQSLYVVYGRPGLEAKFKIALANRAGWNLQYDIERDKAGNIIACTAYSDKGGIRTMGPKITAQMVKAEGWDKPKPMKNGGNLPSKWTTLPEMMYRYRAGSYFVNVICPDLAMGMPSADELEDVIDIQPIVIPKGIDLGAMTPGNTEVLPTPEPEEALPSYGDLVAEYVSGDLGKGKALSEYLLEYSKHSKTDIEQCKAFAATRWPEFVQSFEKWQASRDAKAHAAANQNPAVAQQAPKQGGPVTPITSDQIDQIENLLEMKNPNWDEVLAFLNIPKMPLVEFDYDTAERVIEYLKAL